MKSLLLICITSLYLQNSQASGCSEAYWSETHEFKQRHTKLYSDSREYDKLNVRVEGDRINLKIINFNAPHRKYDLKASVKKADFSFNDLDQLHRYLRRNKTLDINVSQTIETNDGYDSCYELADKSYAIHTYIFLEIKLSSGKKFKFFDNQFEAFETKLK